MKAEHELLLDFEVPKKIALGLEKRVTKQIGIRFDMLAFFRTMDEFGVTLGDEINNLSKYDIAEVMVVAVYTGYESYCWEHKQKMEYSKDEIFKFIEKAYISGKQLLEVKKLWMEFMEDFTTVFEKKKKADQ